MILPFVKNISQLLLKDLFFSAINHVWHVFIWFLLLIFVVQLIHTLMDVNRQIKDQKAQLMLQFFNSNIINIWKTLTSPPHISPGYHFWQAGIRSVISEVRNHFLFSCTVVSATTLYRTWHCTVSGTVPYWTRCIGARYCIGFGRLGQMTSGG